MENLKIENHHFKNGLACPFYVIMPQREREYITLWACERYNGFPNKQIRKHFVTGLPLALLYFNLF